jgi:hypothetical protein
MGKTALDYVREKMFEGAKGDSTSAGGWEAIEYMARMKIQLQYDEYFIAALTDYLLTQPYPVGSLNEQEGNHDN